MTLSCVTQKTILLRTVGFLDPVRQTDAVHVVSQKMKLSVLRRLKQMQVADNITMQLGKDIGETVEDLSNLEVEILKATPPFPPKLALRRRRRESQYNKNVFLI